jgi:hypothetical protein
MYNIQFANDIRLDISNDRKKGFIYKLILGIILFFAFVIIITPIVALAIMMSSGNGISLGFIITCIVSFLISQYLLKLYLWNKYGKETFILQKDKLISYNDYKFFKDSYKEMYYKSMRICIMLNEILMDVSLMSNNAQFSESESIICFDIDGKVIKSNGKIPVESIIAIERHWNLL